MQLAFEHLWAGKISCSVELRMKCFFFYNLGTLLDLLILHYTYTKRFQLVPVFDHAVALLIKIFILRVKKWTKNNTKRKPPNKKNNDKNHI